MNKYVHGYSEREAVRLEDQANTLTSLLHHDSVWKPGETILEAGCGTGSQTKVIATRNPDSQFTSVDISDDSLRKAGLLISSPGLNNVHFRKADILDLPYDDEYFDHVFVCFVLEHLPDYQLALKELKRVLKKKGSITLIEGDHGSAYFHPDSRYARKVINCLIRLQEVHGGNANIGRQLFPILSHAGFANITVSPRVVYADKSRPEMAEGFTRNTFTAMIEGIKDEAVRSGMITVGEFDRGIADLYRTAEPDGTFNYTFFKGTGFK